MLTEVHVGLGGGYSARPHAWDVVILDDNLPVIVIEIKLSLSSASKNIQNALDSIVALASNVARTFDGPGRAPYKPCVAAALVTEEYVGIMRPSARVSVSTHGDVQLEPIPFVDFVGAALSEMVRDGLLDAAFFMTVDTTRFEIKEPSPELSFDTFAKRLHTYIAESRRDNVDGSRSAVNLGRVLSQGEDVDEVVSGLTSTPEGLSAAESAVVRERRRIVAELQQLSVHAETNETKMHKAIGSRYWIFGGQYVGIANRRSLMPLDQYDIPLICADGSLEIVELKGPEARIVVKHRGHFIVSNDVHHAVSQCLNYLRALDELGAGLRTQYRNELGIDFDFRRAKGTVIIGHPERSASDEATREQIDQTVRSYNAHLSRLTVITYADLLESAERVLRFESEEAG
jgi:hypothetical protein